MSTQLTEQVVEQPLEQTNPDHWTTGQGHWMEQAAYVPMPGRVSVLPGRTSQ
jgi:hypothetical protein